MLAKINKVLTPGRRKAIYGVVAAAMPVCEAGRGQFTAAGRSDPAKR